MMNDFNGSLILGYAAVCLHHHIAGFFGFEITLRILLVSYGIWAGLSLFFYKQQGEQE